MRNDQFQLVILSDATRDQFSMEKMLQASTQILGEVLIL
jgi:hypothetical protein